MNTLGRIVNKFFPFMVPLSLLLGMLIGNFFVFEHWFGSLAFAFITFMGGLKMSFSAFPGVIKNPKPVALSIFILRVLMPLWAVLLTGIFFQNDVYTRTGLLLFSVLPIGINSVLWTMMAKGNMPLSLTVLLIDTFLAPFLIPFSILILTGAHIEMDAIGMMINLLLIIGLPTFAGMLVNQLTKGQTAKKYESKIAVLSKVGIFFVMLVNGTNVVESFPPVDLGLIVIIGAMVVLSMSGYTMAWFLAKFFKLSSGDLKATVFVGIRNINMGILIAITHFPTPVSIPIISGVLFQQMVCAFFANKLLKHFNKEDRAAEKPTEEVQHENIKNERGNRLSKST